MKETIIVFSDQVGRTVVGKTVKETDTELTVANPVILHVQPNGKTGQLSVQSYPYLFMEFIEGDDKVNDWTFSKASIAVSNATLTDTILAQYNSINTPAPESAGSPDAGSDDKVIKLFDK